MTGRRTSRILCWLVLAVIVVCTAQNTAAVPPEDTVILCAQVQEEVQDGTVTLVLWDFQRQMLQQRTNQGGEVRFSPMVFAVPGRYLYYITQAAGEEPDKVYDSTVWQVIVEVVRKEGGLSAIVAEVNRICGDWEEPAEVLEACGPDAVPTFRNTLRQGVEVPPPLAQVPATGGLLPWRGRWFLFAIMLFLLGKSGKKGD